jgi:hypothetical protein
MTQQEIWDVLHWLEPASYLGVGSRTTPNLEAALEQIAPDMIEAGASEDEFENARKVVEAGLAEMIDGKLTIHWDRCD